MNSLPRSSVVGMIMVPFKKISRRALLVPWAGQGRPLRSPEDQEYHRKIIVAFNAKRVSSAALAQQEHKILGFVTDLFTEPSCLDCGVAALQGRHTCNKGTETSNNRRVAL